MRRLLATSLALGLLTIAPAQLFAKANTVRIKISGAGLHVPIEITDAKTLANFWVWGGPGSGPYKTQSFIVDGRVLWHRRRLRSSAIRSTSMALQRLHKIV